MIETSPIDTVEREPVNHAGVAIGNEELTRRTIECEAAQRRAGIGYAIEHHIGEQRHGAGSAVDLPD